ncbi:MAG TPA: dihydroorotase [Opitutaceae bacterium]
MSDILWIKNGRVIDPASGRDERGDVFAVDGRFVATLDDARKQEARVIDASGLVVCPGLVDIHVHLREPGQTHKETIQTGSWAAANGGFTTIVCMPNTVPPADHTGTIQLILDAIKRESVVRVHPTGCITVGQKGQALAGIGSLKRAGCVAITDDGLCVQDNELMRRAMEYADMFHLPVMDHCQDESLTKDAVMHEGVMSTRLGVRGWPAAAEDIIVSRDVILSTHTGAHIHLQHISSGTAVEIVRRAKLRSVRVTCEATPHHIALTDACLGTYDTNFKMNPPLRTEADRRIIVDGLKDGTIDCMATDHAPHTNYEKDKEFDFAPFGIVGLETALPVTLDVLHRQEGMELIDVLALFTHKAARVLKLDAGTLADGAPADIAIFEPEEKWVLDVTTSLSKSLNSPWLGKELCGRVRHTIVGGKVVCEHGRIC